MNLNQVTIPSVSLAQSASFYQKLGLRLIVDSIPRYARFECPDGHSTLSLHQVDKVAEGEGIILYFECDQLDETVETLRQSDISFDSEPEDQPWLWREARLKDPDGHQIILFHAGDNRKNPPWRVKN